MPRVSEKKKNKAGKPYDCGQCSDKIVAGETYYEWSFRYGGTHRQHAKHGRPKQSQLTQSKMSGVYSAVEAAEDAIQSADCVEDLRSALDECASSVGDVRDEYQEGIDGMISPDGVVGQESQEKIDALEEFISELESASGSLEDFSDEEPELDSETREEWEQAEREHLDGQRETASEALGNLSI